MIWMLWSASLVIQIGGLAYVFLSLAPEASQGFVQKIFFFHVPSAFVMYAALFFSAIFAGLYLFRRRPSDEILSRSFAETSLFFAFVVIVSGPIWAKPIWGVYWTWDPRLTTTFVVFMLLLAAVSIRRVFQDRNLKEKGAMISSVLIFLALLDVPLIHWSVTLWRGIHPSVIRKEGGLPSEYSRALELMSLSFFLLGALVFYVIWKIRSLERRRADGDS